jgi:dipeptidyl aminopeptidase/acylaminoacyl peptidase
MRPSDLAHIVAAGTPAMHRDRIAFAVTRVDLEGDRYVREVWLSDGSGPRRLTAGPGDAAPEWSPDGSRIAFLRAVDGKPQVAVIPVDGGEAEVLTDFPLGAETIRWSPSGDSIVAVGIDWAEEWGGITDEERTRRPRRITSIPYRFDNRGWIHDRRRRLYLVDPNGSAEPRRLTTGDHDEETPWWSPDGRFVAYLSDRSTHRGLERGVDVYAVDVATGESRTIGPRGMWLTGGYRPDGALHLVGDERLGWPGLPRVFRVSRDGGLTDLTGHLDRAVVSLAAGLPTIRFAGDDAYVGLEDSGRFGIVRVRPDGEVDHLVSDRRVVTGFDVDPTGSRIAFTASTVDRPAELFAAEDGDIHRITDLNPGEDLSLVEGEWFQVYSDGHEIDAWAYLPPGDEPVPLLRNVHGGPASQYGFGYFDEFQVYAGAGYGVIACNPRGSSGRGETHVKAVTGEGWGTVDLADVTAVVEAALGRYPRLDPKRMGVMGGSYGGFLTAWITAHQGRWRSAVVERALLSWPSFSGTSDIGGTFAEDYLGTAYPDGWDDWWAKSPMAFAHQVTTPTLVVHAENDHRCPIEQAEQYFVALLRNGTPAEMLRFPGEGHEMSRSGSPKHRVERLEAILDWHRRHLT